MVPILILAAGASARFAPRDKLTEEIKGEPLLRRTARAALATGAPVLCTLPPDRPARRQALKGLPVQPVEVADAHAGMSASLRTGIAALPPGATGVLVLPADMPGLGAAELSLCLDRFGLDPTRILRAVTPDGQPGHPVIFPADLLGELATVEGDAGGRAILAAHRHRVVPIVLAGDCATLDLDTPQDWEDFSRRPAT